jgi:precorrin-8X/cobalt-precorrin-8 methylmutase
MSELSAPTTGDLVTRYALAPAEIEARSLASVESSLSRRFPDADERAVATRMLYAAGDTELATALQFSPGAVRAGIEALRTGSNIVADVRMLVAAIDHGRARALGCPIHCAIDDATVAERARASGMPRAVEAMRLLAPELRSGVAVIGNAPTALLSLLDLVDSGLVQPRLIIGTPVGFVAAAESKAELAKRAVPYVTVTGTRGGSALAAAALNAMLRLAAPSPMASDRTGMAVLFAGHGSRAPGAAEAMLAAVENVRARGLFPIVETGYLEMVQPDLPAALRRCVEQGASRVLVVPYFLHYGMHIRRDIPNILRREAEQYPGLAVSMGRPIGLHADLANVMIAGALEAEGLPDLREQDEPASALPSINQTPVEDDGD